MPAIGAEDATRCTGWEWSFPHSPADKNCPDDMQSAKLNVLLVDDEEEFVLAASKALSRRGFNLFTALSGDEGRSTFRAQIIDVAILDVRLPDADGHDLFYEFKSWRPETQFIILTGHGDLKKAFDMGSQGVFDYISKPCDLDVLAERIRAAVSGRNPDVESSHLQDVHVLLVDDEPDFLASMERILKRRGLTVLSAQNGQEALDTLACSEVHVVILDVKMPGMDGVEILERIKRQYPRVAVIMLTGHATVGTAVKCMQMGAFDHLFKPHAPEELVSKILVAAEKVKKGS